MSSRATAAGRVSPNATAMAPSVSAIRCGASKNTMVRGSADTAASVRDRSPALRGRKPSNVNRSVGSPDSASAVSTALGPGAAVTRRSRSMARSTTRYPGSETEGMPASVTTTTVPPSATTSSSSSARAVSLCSW